MTVAPVYDLDGNLERFEQKPWNDPELQLARHIDSLRRKAEREFFRNTRMSHWDYEELLHKIDEYEKIWTKRNQK